MRGFHFNTFYRQENESSSDQLSCTLSNSSFASMAGTCLPLCLIPLSHSMYSSGTPDSVAPFTKTLRYVCEGCRSCGIISWPPPAWRSVWGWFVKWYARQVMLESVFNRWTGTLIGTYTPAGTLSWLRNMENFIFKKKKNNGAKPTHPNPLGCTYQSPKWLRTHVILEWVQL